MANDVQDALRRVAELLASDRISQGGIDLVIEGMSDDQIRARLMLSLASQSRDLAQELKRVSDAHRQVSDQTARMLAWVFRLMMVLTGVTVGIELFLLGLVIGGLF